MMSLGTCRFEIPFSEFTIAKYGPCSKARLISFLIAFDILLSRDSILLNNTPIPSFGFTSIVFRIFEYF